MQLLRRLLVYWALIGILGGGWAAYDASTLSDFREVALFATIAFVSLLLLVRRNWITASLAAIVTAGLLYYWYDAREKEGIALRPMAAAARTAIDTRTAGDAEFTLTGQTLIWDLRTDRLSPAFHRLPFPLRAKPADRSMTVFLVADVQSVLVGAYHQAGTASTGQGPDTNVLAGAYRDTAEIAVVRWPENRLIGRHSVQGAAPPDTIKVHSGQAHSDVHGDLTGPIVEWIRSIPTAPTAVASTTPAPATPSRTWTESEARAEAVRRYPQLGVASSPMNRAFLERYEKLKASNSKLLLDPAWPIRLAEEVAPIR